MSTANSTDRDNPPPSVPVLLENIPAELRALPQWVCWKYEERDGKRTKPPYVSNGTDPPLRAKTDDPTTWTSYTQAAHTIQRPGSPFAGIGFVFSERDGFAGVDLDGCLDPDGGLLPWALDIVETLDSYTEVSPSGQGVKIFACGTVNGGGRQGNIEVYDRGRYFTVTGNHLAGTPAEPQERQEQLLALWDRIKPTAGTPAEKPTRAIPSPVPLDDQNLLDKARNATNGAKFSTLYDRGDYTAYLHTSGSQEGKPDHTAGDLALCNLLAYWTDGDPARIDRLFRASALMRPKWDEKHAGTGETYGQLTISRAIAGYPPAPPSTSRKEQSMEPEPESDESTEGGEEIDGTPPAIIDPQSKHRWDDLGNAERLVDRYGNNLRYCHEWGKWFSWDGKRWALDYSGEVMRKAKDIARKFYTETGQIEDPEKRKALTKHAHYSRSRSGIRAMVELAQSESTIPVLPGDLDQDPWLLNVQNGTLNLTSGELRPHSRTDLLTKLAPVPYKPSATCPTWLTFLDRIMGGKEDLIRFLQRAVGYSLTGSTMEQCFFILWGSGNNGKSTFLTTIQKLLADYAAKTPTETFLLKHSSGANNDLADLRGARFVCASETEDGRRLAESLVKELTGGESLKARFLYADYFEFIPAFKVWLGTNHKPQIRGTDEAIWRRVRLIPFTVTIPKAERDKTLPQKLQRELPGILAWAVRGCLDWLRDGLEPPIEVQAATEEYRQESDLLSVFLNECCVLTEDGIVKAKDLYESFVDLYGPKALSPVDFGKRMLERFDRVRRGGGNYYLGLGLKGEGQV